MKLTHQQRKLNNSNLCGNRNSNDKELIDPTAAAQMQPAERKCSHAAEQDQQHNRKCRHKKAVFKVNGHLSALERRNIILQPPVFRQSKNVIIHLKFGLKRPHCNDIYGEKN